MYWRERRLREGLYTDGKNVYEATYRYQDGRYVSSYVAAIQYLNQNDQKWNASPIDIGRIPQ